jgi:hypothetical protein
VLPKGVAQRSCATKRATLHNSVVLDNISFENLKQTILSTNANFWKTENSEAITRKIYNTK